MAYSIANNQLLRKHFQEIKRIIDIPNLIDIQKNSYQRFLQADLPASARQNIGVEAVFRSVFPIRDFSETCSLEYVEYSLGTPKYDVEECHQRGMTFAAPMKVKVRLVSWDVDKESGVQSIRDIKEQEVYFGEIPLMTENGTFIINGTERVIVSQLHRSPASSLTTTRARRTRAARCSTVPGLSPTGGPGSILTLIIKIFSSCASTGGASCRPPCCSRPWVSLPRSF